MDLLAELRAKLETLARYQGAQGVRAAVRHVAAGERHLQRGRSNCDDDAYNDVIYRTNQAFEGLLKEAYQILTDSDASELTPYDIEQRLSTEKRFSERVLTAFQRYRKEWRNPSTHDHTLLFSEQEALLALVSVSAFAAVLIDQIIESVSFRNQQLSVQDNRTSLDRAFDQVPFNQEIVSLLKMFARSQRLTSSADGLPTSETELIGALAGFLAAADPGLDVRTTVKVGKREVDLLLVRDEIKAPIEIKRGGAGYFLDAAAEQVKTVLIELAQSTGFVFMPPASVDEPIDVVWVDFARDKAAVAVVAPTMFIRPRSKSRTG